METSEAFPNTEVGKEPFETGQSDSYAWWGILSRKISFGGEKQILLEKEFPGGPVVSYDCALTAEGPGATPGWGTNIPQVAQRGKKMHFWKMWRSHKFPTLRGSILRNDVGVGTRGGMEMIFHIKWRAFSLETGRLRELLKYSVEIIKIGKIIQVVSQFL